jgi:hypothetical protein
MNYYIVRETDTGKIRALDTVWSIDEVKKVGLWVVLEQCKTKIESKAKFLELSNES